MFGFLSPPRIPPPVRPDDFTREERDRHRSIITEGDPLRARRDQAGIDRLLTNAVTEITGPTGAFTLSQRQHADDQTGRHIAEFLGQSAELEERRRDMSEERLGMLESERRRDLDEYEQMVQSHQAAEEVARKNWQSGLLRAGAGLLSVAAPGIGTAIGAGVGLLAGGQRELPPEDRRARVGMTAGNPMGWMGSQWGTQGFVGVGFDREDEAIMPPLPDDMGDIYGTPTDPTRFSVLGY